LRAFHQPLFTTLGRIGHKGRHNFRKSDKHDEFSVARELVKTPFITGIENIEVGKRDIDVNSVIQKDVQLLTANFTYIYLPFKRRNRIPMSPLPPFHTMKSNKDYLNKLLRRSE